MPLRCPRIICHMVTSAERWITDLGALVATHEAVADRLDAVGGILSRETMAYFLPYGVPNIGRALVGRPDQIADRGGRGLAVCFDQQGRLRPESPVVEGEHLVLVLSKRVSDAYVEALAARGVSLIFSRPEGEDIAIASVGARRLAYGTKAAN